MTTFLRGEIIGLGFAIQTYHATTPSVIPPYATSLNEVYGICTLDRFSGFVMVTV
jgi:hypothetical protein